MRKPSSIGCCSVLLCLIPTSSFATPRRALIICGLPGDEEHYELFLNSVKEVHGALTGKFGFDADRIRIQFGRHEDDPAPTEINTHGRATADEIAREVKLLKKQISSSDRVVWVFVIAHAHFDGRNAYINIPDDDLSHPAFCKLFADMTAEQSVFFINTPVSGYFIKHLSRPDRIIVTATDADTEINESLFHTSLAKTMEEIEPTDEYDLDRDGNVSLLDLYIKANQDLAQVYLADQLLATEHPQLDDNGDGRGSELQIDYLTEEQGGRSDSKRRLSFRRFKDGSLAAKLILFSQNP